ncbi:MAG: hypothetical protein AAFV95_10265 [Bacteroidota bacterium]
MKKIALFTSLLMMLNIGLLSAQSSEGKDENKGTKAFTTKGNKLFGLNSTINLFNTGSELGSIGWTTIKEKSDDPNFREPDSRTSFGINFLPRAGYFVADNLAVGLGIVVGFAREKGSSTETVTKQRVLGVEPFVRYYVPTTRVLPFVEVSGSVGSVKSIIDFDDRLISEDVEGVVNTSSVGGGLGMACPLGDRILFDVIAGYRVFKVQNKEDNPDNFRTIIGVLGLRLGLTVIL